LKIYFLTYSLQIGGTERQLVELAKGLCRKGHLVKVLVFYSGGPLEKELRSSGIIVLSLNKKSRWDIFLFFLRLLQYVKQEKPEILYAFLGTPCLFAIFLKFFFHRLKIVWGVRASLMDLSKFDPLWRLSYKLECWLSVFADLVIANSNAGKIYAIQHGFPHNIVVIPNGIDTYRFSPNVSAGRQIRDRWKISHHQLLIGWVARMDPMKDLHTFLAGASLVGGKNKNASFVCIGNGLEKYVDEIRSTDQRYQPPDNILWAGIQDEMPKIYNSFDLLVSSSIGEGFSNVIAEAMACGIPCVVTNVGDSPLIVGDTGIVIPPRDPILLANAICAMFERRDFRDGTLKNACRDRIVSNYGLTNLIESTEDVFKGLRCTK
jgi:glycosyltransferase involved in cell wall biosynthesis